MTSPSHELAAKRELATLHEAILAIPQPAEVSQRCGFVKALYAAAALAKEHAANNAAAIKAEVEEKELLIKVLSDDGACFYEPIGDIPGSIEIRTECRDNAEWQSFPCEYDVDANGWGVPRITPEIRSALEAALIPWDGIQRSGPLAVAIKEMAAAVVRGAKAEAEVEEARAECERLRKIAQLVADATIAGGRAFDEPTLYAAWRLCVELGIKRTDSP